MFENRLAKPGCELAYRCRVYSTRQEYLRARVLGPASADDALHIAVATVTEVDLVVSWNFRHIVHFDKIAGFEGVNTLNNYRSPRIYSPREVIEREENETF